MSTNSCSFVVWADGPGRDELVDARARALERFYRPAGLSGVTCAAVSESLWVGTIGAPAGAAGAVASWGAPFGAADTTPDLVRGSDESLRRAMVGFGMAVAWGDGEARLVTAPSGPGGLYHASGPGLRVWATHAVAAAYLATGAAELDPEAIPELVAFDFVGSTRTMIRGVEPVPPALRIELSARGVEEESWWPPQERWAAIPEQAAYAHTAASLLESLDARTGSKRLALALTAGADSRVLAVAFHELGKAASAFCWGDPGWPDVEGARAVARDLDMPFADGARWRTDADMRVIFDAETRFSDGRAILSPSEREWPRDAEAIALGAAGEVGRTFYYRRHVDGPEPQGPADLARFLGVGTRLPGADPAAHAAAGASVAAWLDGAAQSGLSGWRLLDVLYAEQRVACWGRIQVPALAADFVAGFSPQQVVRGLASLPLAERASDGFHRRFIAERRPGIALPDPPPAPAVAPRWRREFARARRRLSRRPPGAAAGDPLLLELWGERPATRDWVAEEVLGSPLITGALGESWAATTRERFLSGHKRPCEQAAVAAGPVALAAALAELPG